MTAKERELTYLTVKLMAEKYQVSEFALRRLAQEKRIPCVKVGRTVWIGEPAIKGHPEGWGHAHSYLTVKQAEGKYQVSETTLRHAIREQQIPHVYIGGSVRIREFCGHCGEVRGQTPASWDSSHLAPLQKGR